MTAQDRKQHSGFATNMGPHEESLVHILSNVASKLNHAQNLDQTLAKKLNIVDNDMERRLNPYLSHKSIAQNISNPKPITINSQQKSQKFRNRSQSVDYESVGGVFDIDLDDENAFDSISYSDEEEDDSIEFRHNSNDYNSNRRTVATAQHIAPHNTPYNNAQTDDQMMAYSLPIDVPKLRTFHNDNDTDDDNVSAEYPNGDSIAESIKKLAKSVRNDSDIFGDLPRRRTNTFGDIIKSRPL